MQVLGFDLTEAEHSQDRLNDGVSGLQLDGSPGITLSEVLLLEDGSWLSQLRLVIQGSDLLD